MQMQISSDLLYTNMFLKIQNIHTLVSLDFDSLTVRCLGVFCALFLKDQHFVSGFVPRLLLGGD